MNTVSIFKMKKIITTLLAVMAFVPMLAQSFNDDYASVGVYDTWELSPFRTGVLSGNVQVIENHLYSQNGVNRTGHILGIQRSRFGSNTFGARVDLNSPVTIGKDGKYVHALVYSPIATQVQFIGLGKRTTNTWNESSDVEQFWSDPVSIRANTWTDIVAQVQTNDNVVVSSIVVVPDCSSPHALTADFVSYIDEIEVNNSSRSRTAVTSTVDPYDGSDPGPGPDPQDPDESLYYKTNFDKATQNSRVSDGRYIMSVSLEGSSNTQTCTVTDSQRNYLYIDATSTVFNVTAGETYKAGVNYGTDWMHAYAYVDYNRDGEFTNKLKADGYTVDEGSELVTYSAYSQDYTGGHSGHWYKSDGTSLGEFTDFNFRCNTTDMPEFTIPSTLQSGRYRMRFKVDWNSLDAGGNDGSDGTNNTIWDNGGAIVDVMLNVTGVNEVDLQLSSSRNGSIQDSEGNNITGEAKKVAFNTPYQVMMKPASGFESNSLTATYKTDDTDYPGHLTDATVTYSVSDDCYDATADAFTLPASIIYSWVSLEPLFLEASTPSQSFNLEIGEAGWATLYLDYAVTIPEGLSQVFYISSIDGDVAKGTTITGVIPPLTGVIIQGNTGTYQFRENSNSVEKPTDNLLTGTLEDITDASKHELTTGAYGKNLYTLGRTKSGNVQLALFTGTSIGKNKAFLITSATDSQAKAFSIVTGSGATAIHALDNVGADHEEWYTLQGIRLNGKPAQKGVYIHGGKRIYVK